MEARDCFWNLEYTRRDSINRLADLRPDVHWYRESLIHSRACPRRGRSETKKGDFHVNGTLTPVTWNSLIMGFFEQTLPEFVAEHHHQLHFFTLVRAPTRQPIPSNFRRRVLEGTHATRNLGNTGLNQTRVGLRKEAPENRWRN